MSEQARNLIARCAVAGVLLKPTLDGIEMQTWPGVEVPRQLIDEIHGREEELRLELMKRMTRIGNLEQT